MRHERRAARAAFDKYLAAVTPPAALVLELLGAVAEMVATDTERKVSYVVDGFLLNRQPTAISSYGRRGSGASEPAPSPDLQVRPLRTTRRMR